MKNGPIAAAALALLCAAPAAQGPLTPEQTLDRRAIGEVAFSPDGTRVAFTVTEPPKGTGRQRNIWLADLNGGVRQLTFSAKSDSSPRWSPDGTAIAFLSDRDGAAAGLYRLPLAGGEAEKLTEGKDAVTAFRWSPDGKRIALLMAEPKPAALEQREKDKDDGHVVDKDERQPRVWLLDVATRHLERKTSGTWRIAEVEWAPDGERLVAVATPTPASDQWNEHLVSIDLATGRFSDIATPRGPVGALAVSPDGRTLAYTGARVDGPDAHDLWLQPAAGGAPQNLTGASLDRPVSSIRWAGTDSIAVLAQRGFSTTLVEVGRGGAVRPHDDLVVNATAFDRSADGTIAYAGETAARAPELWIKKASGTPKAVTSLNHQWDGVPVVTPEIVTFKSTDGLAIEAALLLPPSSAAALQPPGARPNHPLPFVVLVHGGPTGRWSDAFEPWGQLLAARGYAVLYPNIRGSTGYGEAFVEKNRADWGGGDFKDVMAAVDWAAARGIADPNRLGIGGWSYGGYMAAWAVTQTTRFKAAVSGAPVIDMASEFGTENGSAYDEWFYGTPYEKLDGFIRSSPITHVRNARTPTLLLQGESDVTDPIGQSQQFYRGLKRYGVETELVLYPREGHGLREEKHLVDRLTRILAWYERYLKPTT
ncbi:MAG TPA: S9 family peptidase [Vicinamibacterales bacterium]|jgi:dipeptidyl aminopeptidase/acylaminoacyl peptidase|nr:S9 family peptidase [Vicinamibacterales bacterium]